MALRYYDEAIVLKLKKWLPEESNLRVLAPDETKRLFETKADDINDAPIKLPFIALSRDTDIELLATTKQNKSFRGLVLSSDKEATINLNVIPVKLEYSLYIYTKKYDEADEYLRNFLFKLINNPRICIGIPYMSNKLEIELQHVANIRVASNVADTSDIGERLFAGQFTRWTINFEIQDAFLFSVPYRRNWRLDADFGLDGDEYKELSGENVVAGLELTNSLQIDGEIEQIVDDSMYKDITYTWSKLGNRRMCTATASYKGRQITETVEAIYIIDQRATLARVEKGHFEAVFRNSVFKKQIFNLV